MKRLEYIGAEVVHRDPVAFLNRLRKEYPHTSEKGIQAIAAAEFEKRHPRHAAQVLHLLGQDILADDVTTIAAWSDVDGAIKTSLLSASREQREKRIDPPGLSRTYVWRQRNGWVQEVTDHDVEILRKSSARGWFHDIDVRGPWVQPRTWDFPVRERFEASTIGDAQAIVRDLKRQQQWRGR